MTVTTYEISERGRTAAELLSESLAAASGELLLLPIPSADGERLRGSDTPLADITERVSRETCVVGYALPRHFRDALLRCGAFVFDLAESEDFLSANAALTAEAALGILLTSELCAPSDRRIGIVGYGRIGKRLTTLLMFLGAAVRVYTTSERRALSLGEVGAEVELIGEDTDFSGVDILVNTAPAPLFSSLVGRERPRRIIELASGNNFPPELAVERFAALPARVFPLSAGRIVAREALEALRREGRV